MYEILATKACLQRKFYGDPKCLKYRKARLFWISGEEWEGRT